MNYEALQKEIDAFLNEKKDIAIFGAGYLGMICYDWLKALNHTNRVKYFCDNNVAKHNTTFKGLPVFPQEKLRENNQISVIIASLAYSEVIRGLLDKGITNNTLYFDERYPCCSDISEYTHVPAKDIYPHYNVCDAETKQAINYCVYLREKYKGGAVFRPDSVKRVDYQEGYWQTSHHGLDMFEHLSFIDAGAYDGRTFQHLLSRYGSKISKYYAFEPDATIYTMLEENIVRSGYEVTNAKLYPAGVGDTSNSSLMVSSQDAGTGRFSLTDTEGGGGISVQVIAIDDVELETFGKLCIKMDIEGFEMKALKGATETIKKYKPELAICVYHKYNDILDVPRFIKSIVPEYNTILINGSNMVCYASVERFS